MHYSLITLENKVIKDAQFWDSLNKKFSRHLLCMKIKAAGLINDFPCIIIWGIYDYTDLEKEKT